MTSFYESATSGLNFDRFTDEVFNESTVTKMKQHFWTAKQLLRTKLGKKEDEHLEASDADFDMKLSLYFSIRDTSRSLLACMEDYHHWMSELVETEKDLGDFLTVESRREKEHLARVMQSVGKTQRLCSRQRGVAVRPLIRLYHDMDVFNERAIGDCAATVDAAEKARLEYRGSLLWMKKTSAELNPENSSQLEDYRTAQNVVRVNKEKLDKLKEDTLQKVDLLNTSRRTLLLSLTKDYALSMQKFYEDSVKAYDSVLAELKGIDTYEIDILKILNDPVGTAIEQQKERNEAKRKRRGKPQEASQREKPDDTPMEGSLVELDDISDAAVEHIDAVTTKSVVDDLVLLDLHDYTPVNLTTPVDERPSTSADAVPKTVPTEQNFQNLIEPLRVESPLGFLAEDDDEHFQEHGSTNINVGPLPVLPSLGPQDVPKLEPPKGWINRVKNTAHDLLSKRSDTSSSMDPSGFWNPFSSDGDGSGSFMPSDLVDARKKGSKESGAVSESGKDWTGILEEFDPFLGARTNEKPLNTNCDFLQM